MKVLLSVLTVLSVQLAGAMGPTSNTLFPPSDIADMPSDSEWAVAMTERACKIRIVGEVQGTITKDSAGSKSVIYTVYDMQGNEVAAAWASSKRRWAKKECLTH